MRDERNRRSLRLPGYDYTAAGACFVTICAFKRQLLFEDEYLASLLVQEWNELPKRFPTEELDAFVVMPNHVHFVLIMNDVAAGLAPAHEAPTKEATTVGAVVGAYKSLVAVKWLRWLKTNRPYADGRIWQRNYYERIVRNEGELNRIRE